MCLSVCVRLSVCIMYVCACVCAGLAPAAAPSAGHAGSPTIPTPVGRTVIFLTLKTARLQDCPTGTDTLLRLLTIFFPELVGRWTQTQQLLMKRLEFGVWMLLDKQAFGVWMLDKRLDVVG